LINDVSHSRRARYELTKAHRLTATVVIILFVGLTLVLNQPSVKEVDLDAGKALNALPSWLDLPLRAVGWYGSGIVWLIVVAAAALVPRMNRAVVVILAISMMSSWLIEAAVKNSVQRPRPIGVYDVVREAASGFSYPSGHAVRAFLGSYVLSSFRKELALPLFLVAGGVALSRIYLGVHYPTDVIGGALLGTLIGMLFANQVGRYIAAKLTVLAEKFKG